MATLLNKHMYDKNASIFQKYIALTTQKPLLVETALGKIKSEFDLKKDGEFTFLDIGCGDGIVTAPLADRLNELVSVNTICIEPSTDLIADFKARSFRPVTFIQENAEAIPDLPKADFILMSHLLPYIEDVDSFLAKVKAALSPRGLALIVINNEESDDSIIKGETLGKVDSLSVEAQKILKTKGIRFSVDTINSIIDASGCREMTETGKTIISFFKHKPFGEIPEEQKDKLREIILELADKDGMLTKKEDYIWIYAE